MYGIFAVVLAVLVVVAVGLGVIGACFSLRTLRLVALGTALLLTVVVAEYGLLHPDPAGPEASLIGSFLRGGDKLTATLLSPLWRLWNKPVPTSIPGVAGRWIIIAALVLGYRQLEAWSRRWQAPVLDLSALDVRPPAPGGTGTAADSADSADQLHDQLAAALRFRLPAMEIRTPAILPGGSRAKALASIAESSGVSGAGLVGGVIRLASLCWPGPGRVRVRVWIDSAPGGSRQRVSVLLDDPRSGRTVATKTVPGRNFQEVASMAAGYIARQIFAMDRTVPTWCYGTADGRDLGEVQLARMERTYARCPADVRSAGARQIEILASATGNVRSAPVVRYELAQLYALQGQHLESLALHALNRELDERFYRGRYRLAMTLEMNACRHHLLPDTMETRQTVQRVLDSLYRSGLTDGQRYQVRAGQGAPGAEVPVAAEISEIFLAAAAEELRQVRKQLGVWPVFLDTLLRRDERPVWLPHWVPRHRETFRDGVCVAQLFVHVRQRLLPQDNTAPARGNRAIGLLPRTAPPEKQPTPEHRGHRGVPPYLRKPVRIAAHAVGDNRKFLTAVLTEPRNQWPRPSPLPVPPRPGRRVRRLPGLRRRVSWQAAYNMACLYAALAAVTGEPATVSPQEPQEPQEILQQAAAVVAEAAADLVRTPLVMLAEAALEVVEEVELARTAATLEEWVIESLRRAIEHPGTELDRPSSWISQDPDFHPLCRRPTFTEFVCELKEQDYPEAAACAEHQAEAMLLG